MKSINCSTYRKRLLGVKKADRVLFIKKNQFNIDEAQGILLSSRASFIICGDSHLPNSNSYWVYMLLCDNNTYYTGYTHDLVKRYQSHLDGSGRCKYTRSFKPVKIAQCWKIQGAKADAMWLERLIKKMSRSSKEDIIAAPWKLCEWLASEEHSCIVSVEPGTGF